MVIREMKNNNTENVDYHPIKFIDHLDRNKHIVLLFDNEKYAYWIISRDLLNGLKNNESRIFFTPDDPETVEERLSFEGIGMNIIKPKKSLSIYDIEKSYDNKLDIFKTQTYKIRSDIYIKISIR